MVLESLAAVMPLLTADHTNLKQLHLVLQLVYNLFPCNCCGLSFGLLLHVRVMKYVGLLPEVPCMPLVTVVPMVSRGPAVSVVSPVSAVPGAS